MRKKALSGLVAAVVLCLAIACARKPDDAKISNDIQSRFSQDSGLSTKQLGVQSENGLVTLNGTVDNEAQRQAASRQAASVAGVKEVVNNLQVGTAVATASTPATAAAPAAQTNPASAADTKPTPGRKSKKARASSDSTASSTSGASSDPNADQTMANNQPTADPQPVSPPADTTPPPPPPPPPPKTYIIDQGTQISVRLIDLIDSEKNQAGDTFHATLNAPLNSDGDEAVPAGAELMGHLVDVKSAGKFAGQSLVSMQLDSLSCGGKTYNVQTDQYKKQGSSRGKNTAEKVGGGAIVGSIIGALAGGGKGAAIGGAAGAGVGGGVQAASKSQQIKLPPETVLNFTLQSPVTVTKAPNPNANRPKLGDSQ